MRASGQSSTQFFVCHHGYDTHQCMPFRSPALLVRVLKVLIQVIPSITGNGNDLSGSRINHDGTDTETPATNHGFFCD